MRQCTKCLKFLAENHFTKRVDVADKLRSHCRDCCNQDNLKRYHDSDKERHAKSAYKYNLKVNYDLTVEDYNKLFLSQDGKCAICEVDLSNRFLNIEATPSVIDHSHETGKVRSILCSGCNIGLGSFNDSLFKLSKACRYIEAHSI